MKVQPVSNIMINPGHRSTENLEKLKMLLISEHLAWTYRKQKQKKVSTKFIYFPRPAHFFSDFKKIAISTTFSFKISKLDFQINENPNLIYDKLWLHILIGEASKYPDFGSLSVGKKKNLRNDSHVRFTTVPFKPLSDQGWIYVF